MSLLTAVAGDPSASPGLLQLGRLKPLDFPCGLFPRIASHCHRPVITGIRLQCQRHRIPQAVRSPIEARIKQNLSHPFIRRNLQSGRRLSPAFRFLHLPGKNGAHHPKSQRVGQMVYYHVINLHTFSLQFPDIFTMSVAFLHHVRMYYVFYCSKLFPL